MKRSEGLGQNHYSMILYKHPCWLFGSHYITDLHPPGLPISDVISPSSTVSLLGRQKEREEGGRKPQKAREVGEVRAVGAAGLPGKGADLASHHTQPASAYV